jgi:hypothetical protein
MNAAVEPIDGGKATLAELRRAGIDALAKALGPVGMPRAGVSRRNWICLRQFLRLILRIAIRTTGLTVLPPH